MFGHRVSLLHVWAIYRAFCLGNLQFIDRTCDMILFWWETANLQYWSNKMEDGMAKTWLAALC